MSIRGMRNAQPIGNVPIENLTGALQISKRIPILQGEGMTLGIAGFDTKKALKAAIGEVPDFIETSMFGDEFNGDGTYTVVGPSPYVRKWFATITVSNGCIAKVN